MPDAQVVPSSQSPDVEATPANAPPKPSVISKRRRFAKCVRDAIFKNPVCFCEFEDNIFAIIAFGVITDTLYIIMWISFLAVGKSITYTAYYPGQSKRAAVDILILHGFCFITNVTLILSVLMRVMKPVYAWIIARVVWTYCALSIWIQSLNVYQAIYERDLKESEDGPFPLNWKENLIWQVAMWSYWPMVLIHCWTTFMVVTFGFKLYMERKYLQQVEQYNRTMPRGSFFVPGQEQQQVQNP